MSLGYGKLGFTDYYLHYKVKGKEDRFLDYSNRSDGNRFYAKDYVDFRKDKQQTNTTKIGMEYLTIMTPTMLNFEVDDIIVSQKDNKKWRINSIIVKDNNTQKQFSNRPKKFTILELVG